MERLFAQLEGEVDLDEPVDEDVAHVRADLGHDLLLFLSLSGGRVTCSDSINAKISSSYSTIASLCSTVSFLSNERDLRRVSTAEVAFSQMELTLARRG